MYNLYSSGFKMIYTPWRLWIFVFYAPCILGNNDPDPCVSHNVLDAGPRLHTLDENNGACDNNLAFGWYKLMVGNEAVQIPTSCLQNNVCGTQLPLRIDLDGQALPTTGNILHAHVCTSYDVLGQWDCCVLRQSVVIKKCSDFFVYQLLPTDRCPVAYCAEDPSDDNYQDILVKRGEHVHLMSTAPPVDSSTQASMEALSQTTSTDSVDSTSPFYEDNTSESSDSPVFDETISTPSLDTNTTSSVISTRVTDSVDLMNATDNSSTPYSNLSSDDVTNFVPNMTSDFMDTSTISMTTPTDVDTTSSIKVTNDTESLPSSTPSSNITSDDVTNDTTASQQVTETSLGDNNTTLNYSTGTSAPSAECINWQKSQCPGSNTICYMKPTSNELYVLCDNGIDCGLICDSLPDCSDSTDEREELCPRTMCPEGMFKCMDDDTCYIRCDGKVQCVNSSHPFEDENDCPGQPNVSTTTEIISNNMSTINETVDVSTISEITSQSSSESHMTSVQSATTSPTSSVDTSIITESSALSSTADSTVVGSSTEQLTITTSQPNNDAMVTASVPLSTNASIESDITLEYINYTTSYNESTTTAVVNVSLTTSVSIPDISATDLSVSTTNISQTVPHQDDSSEETTLQPMSSVSHTPQPEATSSMYSEVPSSTSDQPVVDVLTSTQIHAVSTETDVIQYTTTLDEYISSTTNPSTESHVSSTQGMETSSNPTSKSDVDLSPTTDSDTAEMLSTQSSDYSLLTTIASSGSSESYPSETSSSSNPSITSDMPKTSSAEVPSSSFGDLPHSSIKTVISDIPSSVPLTTVSTSLKYSDASTNVDSITVEAKPTTEIYNIDETDGDNSTAATDVPVITKQPVEDDKDGLIHDNFGLFVFIIVASVCILAISIFGIVGYTYQQRRLRTWTPRMAYQDAYADIEKKNLAYCSTLTGIESPIPDIDIMHEEKAKEEETSLSQTSTLALSPITGHESGFEQELRDSPSPKSINIDGLNNVQGGQTNQGFQGEDIDGIVPVEEIDNEPPRAFFPWIENAEDTKL